MKTYINTAQSRHTRTHIHTHAHTPTYTHTDSHIITSTSRHAIVFSYTTLARRKYKPQSWSQLTSR